MRHKWPLAFYWSREMTFAMRTGAQKSNAQLSINRLGFSCILRFAIRLFYPCSSSDCKTDLLSRKPNLGEEVCFPSMSSCPMEFNLHLQQDFYSLTSLQGLQQLVGLHKLPSSLSVYICRQEKEPSQRKTTQT